MTTTLNKLNPEERAVVSSISGGGALRRRLIDMGITPGTEVIMKKVAPLGDPMEISIRGYSLSLRKLEASIVGIETR